MREEKEKTDVAFVSKSGFVEYACTPGLERQKQGSELKAGWLRQRRLIVFRLLTAVSKSFAIVHELSLSLFTPGEFAGLHKSKLPKLGNT